MDITDKLSFYMELVNCNYDLYIWAYDKNINMIHTNWTESIFSGNFLSYTGLSKLVEEHISSNKRTPLILEAAGSLLWIAGFVYTGPLLEHFYLVGPIYSGRDSQMILRKHLDEYDLTVKLRSMVFKLFDRISTIPTNIISQYAVMLHYCLTNTKISTNDLTYQSIVPSAEKKTSLTPSLEHAGIWYAEEQLLNMIADGNPKYKEALARSASLSAGMKTDSRDSLRYHKNNTLVLLTLSSRACIRGGLDPSISYDLNDFYASRIEECNSMSELQKLNETMLADYVYRVQKSKETSQISAPIRNACSYIKANRTEPLSIHVLAKRCDYSEYYFSYKFKKEMGISVNEYILREKIEEAKLLLSGTTENIQTISDNLSFSNRSYFYTCFQKMVGVSPSEYRSQNHRI